MLLLIGSHALQKYGRLQGREPADWDVMSKATKQKLVLNGQTVEISSANDPDNATNAFLYLYSMYMSRERVDTPAGEAIVAPLEVLKALKLSCAPYLDKAKHNWDLAKLEDVSLPTVLERVVEVRAEEIKKRVTEQRREFFEKYQIPRYIDHDRLHIFVNPVPAYLELLEDAVTINRTRFLALPITAQVKVLREEALVLGLERELIPQVIRVPSLSPSFYIKFARARTSSDPAYRWISRLSIPGKLKDHPEWMAIWAQAHSEDLLDGLEEWWQDSLASLSKDFWVEILSIGKHESEEKRNAVSA